jgi:hypothetical protein
MYPSVIDVGLYNYTILTGCSATAIAVKGERVDNTSTTDTYPPSRNITLQKNSGARFDSPDYTGIVTMYSNTTTTGTYDDSTYAPFAMVNYGIGFYGYGLFEQWRILDQYSENIPVKVYWDSYSELGSNGIMYRTRTATKLSSSAFDWSAYSGFKSAINTNCCTMVGNYVNIEFLFYANKWSSPDYLKINDTFYDLKTFQKNTYIKAQEFNSCFLRTGLLNMLPQGTLSVVPTTGVYDLGSTSAIWDNVYVDEVYCGTIDNQRRWELVSETILTSTIYTYELQGLDSSIDKTYRICGTIMVPTTSWSYYLRFNNHQATIPFGGQLCLFENALGYFSRFSGSDTTTTREIRLTYVSTNLSCRFDAYCTFIDNVVMTDVELCCGATGTTEIMRTFKYGHIGTYVSNVTQLLIFGNTTTARMIDGDIQIWRLKDA